MDYVLYKVIKEKFSGEETLVLCTNNKEYAEDMQDILMKQSSDDELFKVVKD